MMKPDWNPATVEWPPGSGRFTEVFSKGKYDRTFTPHIRGQLERFRGLILKAQSRAHINHFFHTPRKSARAVKRHRSEEWKLQMRLDRFCERFDLFGRGVYV